MVRSELVCVDRLPTVDEYVRLRRAVGWRDIDADVVVRALRGSRFGVCVERNGRAAAMGRVISDGALYFYVQDLVVEPALQRRGLGQMILERLERRATQDGTRRAAILLVAAQDVAPFYRRLGFRRLPDGAYGKRVNTE